MSDIVDQIAAATGLERDVAAKAIGMMLAFLEEEADDVAVAKMMAAVPGAAQLVSEHGGKGSGGFLANLVMGGGLMGLGQQLMGLGMGMGEITALAKQTIAYARKQAGDEVVDKVVASVPGLGQFV